MWKIIDIPIKTHRVIKKQFASKKNFDVLCVDKRKRAGSQYKYTQADKGVTRHITKYIPKTLQGNGTLHSRVLYHLKRKFELFPTKVCLRFLIFCPVYVLWQIFEIRQLQPRVIPLKAIIYQTNRISLSWDIFQKPDFFFRHRTTSTC